MKTPQRPAVPRWPLLLIAAPAGVSVWGGWVGLGQMSGFGIVHPLPGIWDSATLNTAITLPVGVEAYGAYALAAWLAPSTPERARRFAFWSALGSLAAGMSGQIAFHLLEAAGRTRAPWLVVTLVSVLPVLVLGMGAALGHMLAADDRDTQGTEIRQPLADLAAQAAPVSASVPEPPEVSSPDVPNRAADGGTEHPDGTAETAEPAHDRRPDPVIAPDAETAAMQGLRATTAAGNPYSINQLASKFNLSRQTATKVRDLVRAEANGSHPAEAEPAPVN